MFRVSGNQISITAGDTALMAICPDETGYVPTANDRAIFTVRERPKRTGGLSSALKVMTRRG